MRVRRGVRGKEGVGLFLLVLGRYDAVAPRRTRRTACSPPPTPCFLPAPRSLQCGGFRRIEGTGEVAAGEVTNGVFVCFVLWGLFVCVRMESLRPAEVAALVPRPPAEPAPARNLAMAAAMAPSGGLGCAIADRTRLPRVLAVLLLCFCPVHARAHSAHRPVRAGCSLCR